ncbi:MAG: general stress protein [Kofleriaceae bacterium]
MTKSDIAVAIYSTHESAELAVKQLQQAGVDMKSLSIVGRDYHTEEQVVGYYNQGDRMKAWGKRGAFWGGLWGAIFGSAFFFIPGIGPIVLAGPIVSWLVGAVEGAVVVGGLSALGAALFNLGIPKDSVIKYEQALKADHFIVAVHGTAALVDKARSVLQRSGASETFVHAA